MMLKRTLLLCLIGLVSCALIPLSIYMNHDKQTGELRVANGVMDLSAWDEQQIKRIKLDGEWEFYWDQLLTPQDFETLSEVESPHYIEVPSKWNGKIIDGHPLPAYGAATYRMVLKNLPYGGVFGLKKSNIRFSSTVFVNGEKLLEDGVPSKDISVYQPGNNPQISYFSVEQGDIEIIIHVANFDYIDAGIPVSLYFGDQAAMSVYQQKSMAYGISNFAILVALGLIYIVTFVMTAIYRKTDYSLLIFSIICIFYAIYSALLGERPLIMYFPEVPFKVMYKIKDMFSIASIIVLFVWFYQLHSTRASFRLLQIMTILLGTYLVTMAFLPLRTYMDIQFYVVGLYGTLMIWLLINIAIIHIKSDEKNRFRTFLLFMSLLYVNLYSVDLMLFALSMKENLLLGQFYIVLFNVSLILFIVHRFFEAYRTADDMRNQLLRLDKIKDDFLSNTSHELKTPLNAIVSITDTLLRGVEGPLTKKQEQNLAIVMGSGRRLTHLVNELLDYSKMKHGDITLYKSSVELKAIIDSVIRIHMFLLEGKRIALINNVPEDFPEVYADSNRLIQIFHNLIGNAIKFSDHGNVVISAKILHGMVEIRVIDSGVGIAPHVKERIFEAFEQGDSSETRKYGGTGLGLSITKNLVELHGGEIYVESVYGEGSTFIFTVQLSAPITSKARRKAIEEQIHYDANISQREYPIYIKGKRDELILVVDDDFANLQAMMNLLRLEGYPIVVVNRGQMALEELAKNQEIYLIILDIMMPDMSGFEVLAKVRERFTSFELPVLMQTSKNRHTEMKISLDKGANDFVGKPIETEEIMARIRSLTRLKESVKHAKEAEIAFLRSQIKPHFLYNALNSIAALCIDEPEKAQELTLQLSQYLRGSFDFKQLDSLTTIEKEIKLVEAYINIEKARFGEKLQVEYDVDSDVSIQIPPLIVQPLVENAIRHGLMTSLRGGKVTISIKKESSDFVSFVIEDNGQGMNEQKLVKILKPDTAKGVGLWNINQRIKLIYGETLHIDSALGMGTKVSFKLPV